MKDFFELLKLLSTFPYWSWIGMFTGIAIATFFFIVGYKAAQVNPPTTVQPIAVQVPKPFALPGNLSAKIYAPADKQLVDRQVEVSIETSGLPNGIERWLVVYAPGAKLWYSTEIRSIENVYTTSLTLGSDIDHGAHFDIGLFITDQKGDELLRAAINGLQVLPQGSLHKVSVRRLPK
jgi:hypothetical protein